MRRHVTDALGYFGIVTIVFAAFESAAPGLRSIGLHVYLLVVGAIVMKGLVGAVGASVLPRRASSLTQALNTRTSPPSGTLEQARVERLVTLAVSNAWDFHTRLLPQLREIAQARLERTGKQPGPDTLGRWWELMRPDRPEPTDRFAPGISETDLRALVADLQRM